MMAAKLGWLALGSLAALATAVVTGVFDVRDWSRPPQRVPVAAVPAPAAPTVQVVERPPARPDPVELAPVPIQVEPVKAPARPSRAAPAGEKDGAPKIDPQLADLERRLETLAKSPEDNSALVSTLQRFSAQAHRIEAPSDQTTYRRCLSSAERAAGADAIARLRECLERLRGALSH